MNCFNYLNYFIHTVRKKGTFDVSSDYLTINKCPAKGAFFANISTDIFHISLNPLSKVST